MILAKSKFFEAKALGFTGTPSAWCDFVVSQNRFNPNGDKITIRIKNHIVSVSFVDYTKFDWNSTSSGSLHDAIKEAHVSLKQKSFGKITTLSFKVGSNIRYYRNVAVPVLSDDVINKSCDFANNLAETRLTRALTMYQRTLLFELVLNIVQHNYRTLCEIPDCDIKNIEHSVNETLSCTVIDICEGLQHVYYPLFSWYGLGFDDLILREYLSYCKEGPFYIRVCRVSLTKEKGIKERIHKITKDFNIETIVEIHNTDI